MLINHVSSLGPIDFLNVTVSSGRSRTEPQYVWDVDENAYDSKGVRKQLGAVAGAHNLTEIDRQILRITPSNMKTALEKVRGKPVDPASSSKISFLYTGKLGDNISIAFCPVCGGVWSIIACNVVLTNLLADALDETHSPATAVQAAITAQTRMEYYSIFSTFIPAENGTMSKFQSVWFPQSWRGFGGVMGIIAAQLLTLVLITVVFFRDTRFSYPDNAWHTVAQMSESDEIRDVLASSKTADDHDVVAGIRGMLESQDASCLPWKSENSNQPIMIVREGVFKRRARRDPGGSSTLSRASSPTADRLGYVYSGPD